MESELCVKPMEAEMVVPCLPSPKTILYLSNIDDQPVLRMFINVMIVYNAPHKNTDPAKVIRGALSKALVYYYPLAGRLRNNQNGNGNGKLHVECTGEGALFVEATAHNTLSVLDSEHLKSSLQQKLFHFPSDIDIEDHPLLIFQVTSFKCGGVVVGVRFHHSLCDGRGAGQFLQHLGEMAKGNMKPSVEPIWERELLKPRDKLCVDFHHSELIEENICHIPLTKDDELDESSIVLNSETIKELKQCIMKECKESCSAFEVVAAMVWKARTKALQIPYNHNIKLIFAMDVRKKYKPPLSKGYYGNGMVLVCAMATAEEIIEGSLLHAVKIIQKTKASLNDDYLRSSIDFMEMNRHTLNADVFMSEKNIIFSDWRWLGFNEVDFGWGAPKNLSPKFNFVTHSHFFIFFQNPNAIDGINIYVLMHPAKLKLFELQMQVMIRNYATASNHSK